MKMQPNAQYTLELTYGAENFRPTNKFILLARMIKRLYKKLSRRPIPAETMAEHLGYGGSE